MAAQSEFRSSLDNQEGAPQAVSSVISNNRSEKDADSSLGEGLAKPPSAFSAPAMEAYGALLQDTLQDVQSIGEKLYGALDGMEKQEELNITEILVKTAEQAQLSEHLRNNRDKALNAISELTGAFFNHNN